MPSNAKESVLPKDWFANAAQDMKRVDALLAINDDEGARFHLQQAVDLDDLLDDALTFDSHFKLFRDACRFSGEFYVSERYPFPLASTPPRRQLDDAIAQIKKLIVYIVEQTPIAE